MKKKIFLLVVTFVVLITPVSAVCNDAELNSWAENVKINFYEYPDEEGVDKEFAYALIIGDYNEKARVEAKDSIDNKFINIEYDKDLKSFAIGGYNRTEEITYTINIYGSKKSSCSGELLRTMEYKAKPFNMYSLYEDCEKDEYKDLDVCKTYSDTSNVVGTDFDEILDKQDAKKHPIKSILNSLKNIFSYWYLIVIPIVVIGIIFGVKILLFKKKESRK